MKEVVKMYLMILDQLTKINNFIVLQDKLNQDQQLVNERILKVLEKLEE